MVQGINVNNYSVDQLKELKNAGMQGISDADIKAAEEREAQKADAKASDEANMEYTITDDAGQVNEAEQEVKTASEYGANLKTILMNLMPKCAAQNSQMQQLQAEMDKFVVTMEDLGAMAGVLTQDTQAQVAETEAEVQAEVKVVEEKQAEALEQQAVVDEVANNENATEADQAKAEEAAENAEALGSEISSMSDKVKNMAAKAQEQIQQTAITKAALLGKSMEDVKAQAEGSLNDAINANEYADVTIDKGMEATQIDSKKEAKAAGFKKKILFWSRGDVKGANRMGNDAIVAGSVLGNSSQGVAKTVQQVGSQFGMSFAETSSINNMVSKDYADTSALDNMGSVADAKGVKGKIAVAKANAEIINGITEEAKKKKAEQAAPQEGTTGTTEA